MRQDDSSSHSNSLMGETFDFLERRIAEAIMNVTLSLMYTRCEVEHLQTRTLSFLGDTSASQISSFILNMPVMARKLDDVFVTYACSQHMVAIYTSLKYKGLYLTRPLVTVKTNNGSKTIFQVYPDGNGHKDIKYFSKLRDVQQEAVFKIDNLFVYFHNYTFVSIHM